MRGQLPYTEQHPCVCQQQAGLARTPVLSRLVAHECPCTSGARVPLYLRRTSAFILAAHECLYMTGALGHLYDWRSSRPCLRLPYERRPRSAAAGNAGADLPLWVTPTQRPRRRRSRRRRGLRDSATPQRSCGVSASWSVECLRRGAGALQQQSYCLCGLYCPSTTKCPLPPCSGRWRRQRPVAQAASCVALYVAQAAASARRYWRSKCTRRFRPSARRYWRGLPAQQVHAPPSGRCRPSRAFKQSAFTATTAGHSSQPAELHAASSSSV
jgi:hypothetical protein